jgi:FkbM family methyltransferase
MIYLLNYLLILSIKILNKVGRGFTIKKRIFSSQRILEKNFLEGEFFNFIQVGANDGVSFDFLYEFVTKRNSSGIVIEPIKEYFDELVENYNGFPEIIKINKAVHPKLKNIIINRVSAESFNKYPDWVKGIGSIDAEHHKRTGIVESKDIVQEEVEADNLMNIINSNIKIKEINYFQVDTEGFDFEILKMIDFKKIKPSIIKFESVNLTHEGKRSSNSLLRKQNYFLFNEFGDTVALNIKKIKLL